MMMSQFNKDNDVFSDCGIRRRCAPNHFQLVRNRYGRDQFQLFYNSGGRKSISRLFLRRKYRYRKGIKSYSKSTQLIFDLCRERRK